MFFYRIPVWMCSAKEFADKCVKEKKRDYNRVLGTLFAAEHPYSLLPERSCAETKFNWFDLLNYVYNTCFRNLRIKNNQTHLKWHRCTKNKKNKNRTSLKISLISFCSGARNIFFLCRRCEKYNIIYHCSELL